MNLDQRVCYLESVVVPWIGQSGYVPWQTLEAIDDNTNTPVSLEPQVNGIPAATLQLQCLSATRIQRAWRCRFSIQRFRLPLETCFNCAVCWVVLNGPSYLLKACSLCRYCQDVYNARVLKVHPTDLLTDPAPRCSSGQRRREKTKIQQRTRGQNMVKSEKLRQCCVCGASCHIFPCDLCFVRLCEKCKGDHICSDIDVEGKMDQSFVPASWL